ncbi:MAG: hypothetical protein V1936_00365, partial [Patescibacteria group bacterium]
MDIRAPLPEILATTSRHLKALAEIGLTRVEDLLNYFPRKYLDFSAPKKLAELIPNEVATLVGQIENLKFFRTPRGRVVISAKLITADGEINLTWFNQTFVTRVLRNGDAIAISGKIQI